jgi:hypothetical protein
MMRSRLIRRVDRRESDMPHSGRRERGRRVDDERRWRDSGGPEDRAQYSCECGFVWEAEVSTSVTCPHCGASQAW